MNRQAGGSAPATAWKRVLRGLIWVYAVLVVSHNLAFMRSPRGERPVWLYATRPPFGPSTLFLGGQADQRSLRVSLVRRNGSEIPVDLEDYFGLRLWHRPHVSVPNRVPALLVSEPTEAHERLLRVVVRKHRERFPEDELVKGRVYLHRWNFPDGRPPERLLVTERALQ